MIQETKQLVVFALSDQRYGLSLSAVDRVERIVDITPLPKAPDSVLGIVNVQGQVVAVINLRRRFRLPEREFVLTDQLIVARTARRRVALVADAVIGVVEYSDREAIGAHDVHRELQYIDGVVKLDDGLVLIHDLSTFLSLDEETELDQAMESA